MKRLIVFLSTLLLCVSCASTPNQVEKSEQNDIVDHELLEQLCALERQYASEYENKNQAQLDQICEL